MTADRIAEVIQEVYNSGHVTAGGQKLEKADFLQLIYLAQSAILAQKFQAYELQGESLNLGTMLQPYNLPIKTDKYNRKIAMIPDNVIQLPGDIGVYSVTPVTGDNSLSACTIIVRMAPGSEWLYCSGNAGPFAYFAVYGNTIVFNNLDDCIKAVLAYIVTNSETANIPNDIGWEIFKQVYAQIVRTYAISVDKRTDNNPNSDEIFMTKLTSPQINK
jgi:hypothetical protein